MLFAVLCLLASAVSGAVERFDGQRVLRFQTANDKQVAEFEQLFVEQAAGLDIWKNVAGEIDVLVQTHEGEKQLAEFLHKHSLTPSVFIEDVQAAVEKTFEEVQDVAVAPDLQFFTKYQPLEKIHEFLHDIETRYPDIATVFSIGKTYEGRDILGIELSTGSSPSKKKLVNLGGHHAREWVGVAVNAYFVHYFATEYGKNPRVTSLMDQVDIVVFPVVNADGYVYTFTNNRMWRKTRKPNFGSSCVGTDPNRNWGVEWCKAGASRDPCSDAYCGSSAFSESETKAVAEYVTANAASMGSFIDWHAYSQLWMAPWGYTRKLPDDRAVQKKAGEAACAALKAVHGTTFREGTIANIIYEASGSSADWGYETFGLIHSYGVELRDTGRYGFLLPPEQIIPSGEETVEALISMGQTVIDM